MEKLSNDYLSFTWLQTSLDWRSDLWVNVSHEQYVWKNERTETKRTRFRRRTRHHDQTWHDMYVPGHLDFSHFLCIHNSSHEGSQLVRTISSWNQKAIKQQRVLSNKLLQRMPCPPPSSPAEQSIKRRARDSLWRQKDFFRKWSHRQWLLIIRDRDF